MTEQKETTKPTKPLTLSTHGARRRGAAKAWRDAGAPEVLPRPHAAVTVEVKKPVKRPATPAAAARSAGSRRRQPAAPEAAAPAATGAP